MPDTFPEKSLDLTPHGHSLRNRLDDKLRQRAQKYHFNLKQLVENQLLIEKGQHEKCKFHWEVTKKESQASLL